MITLTIPFDAVVPDNRRSMRSRHGTIILTGRYRDGKTAVATLALQQMRKARVRPLDGPLALVAVVYPPDKRRRDLTNSCKSLHDALESVCYADDAQLADVRYRRGPIDRANARIEITITKLPEANMSTRRTITIEVDKLEAAFYREYESGYANGRSDEVESRRCPNCRMLVTRQHDCAERGG